MHFQRLQMHSAISSWMSWTPSMQPNCQHAGLAVSIGMGFLRDSSSATGAEVAIGIRLRLGAAMKANGSGNLLPIDLQYCIPPALTAVPGLALLRPTPPNVQSQGHRTSDTPLNVRWCRGTGCWGAGVGRALVGRQRIGEPSCGLVPSSPAPYGSGAAVACLLIGALSVAALQGSKAFVGGHHQCPVPWLSCDLPFGPGLFGGGNAGRKAVLSVRVQRVSLCSERQRAPPPPLPALAGFTAVMPRL